MRDITQEQRSKLYRSFILPCQRPEYPELQIYQELTYGLSVTTSEIERSVISDRLRAQWKDRVVEELKTLPPSEESFAKIEGWGKEGVRDLADFWPSEQKAFFAALDQGRKRIGEVALVARVDRLVAEPPTYSSLVALETLVNGNTALYSTVSNEMASAQRERARSTLHAGLKTLLDQERVRFDARGEGLVALANGAAWYAEFETRYLEKFEDNPPIQEMETYFKTNRARDIERAQGALKAAINRAHTEQEVAALVQRYVGLDVDDSQRSKLQVAVALRTDSLKFERERWKYSERELALMTRPSEVSVPARYDPPTAEEISLSIIRSYVKNGGEWVSKTTVKPSLSSAVKLVSVPITVTAVELIGCSTQTSSGYHCRYRPSFHIDMFREPTGSGRQDSGAAFFQKIFDGMQRLEQPQVNEEEFLLTSTGWRSPSLEDKVRVRTWPWDVFLGGGPF